MFRPSAGGGAGRTGRADRGRYRFLETVHHYAEQRLRRIREAAPHLCDIAEPQQAAAHREIDVQHVLLGSERAGDTQQEGLVAGLDDTGGLHDVLRLQGRDQSGSIDAEPRNLLHRELDENLFVLRAEDLDL